MVQQNNKNRQNDNTIPMRELFFLCLAHWKWFVVSLIISFGFALYYILSTPPTYVSRATLLIKNDSKGKTAASAQSGSFTEFSNNHRSNAEEELKALQSPATMIETIKRLNLDITYSGDGKFHDQVIYETGLPAKVTFLDISKNDDVSLIMQVQEGEISLSAFSKAGKRLDDIVVKSHDGDTVNTPVGRVITTLTDTPRSYNNKDIFVTRTNINKTIEDFYHRFGARFENENTTIVNLSMKDVSPNRGKAVLRSIIDIYNENWIKDKNQIAVSTDSFLNGRIKRLEEELWQIDGEIAGLKSKNSIQSNKEAGTSLLSEKKETEKELLALTNQQQVVQYLLNILKEEKNYLLPTNIGLENANVQKIIDEYNSTLLRRNAIAQNSSDQNPIVIDYDNRLKKIKEIIVSTANNEIEAINSQIRLARKAETSSNQAIASAPELVKRLQTIERQQKVKNALYLFLLQKREENELSKEYVASNTRVISQPACSHVPIAPMRKNALMMALAIGLIIPTLLIFLREMTNNKVRGRKDLEGLKVPVVGEIPMNLPKKDKKGKQEAAPQKAHNVVVKDGSRDIINEAFRVLRTNIEFMTKRESGCEVIILTSFNPGSGKTFLTMNIGTSLALKGERVLVIDGDMRHGSSSAYIDSPSSGLSNYLNKTIANIDEVIVKDKTVEGLHVLPIGTIPPNPTELLHEERFGTLIAEMRKKYDYILIDCPPIDIVADTQIIEEFADRTLFVIRAGLLVRSMLANLENMYNEKRFKNMSVILNGTHSTGSYYKYSYRYGYRYGYKYGYSYYGNKK